MRTDNPPPTRRQYLHNFAVVAHPGPAASPAPARRCILRLHNMEEARVEASRLLPPGWRYTIRDPRGGATDGFT